MDSTARQTSAPEIAAIPGLVERACRLRETIRLRGTLTPDESREYRQAIATLRGFGLPATWIAREVDISRGRVWKLICLHALSAKTPEAAA